MCEYDETGAIGKRYFRADEAGTPFAICIDWERYAAGMVTVRDRDTGLQDEVAITGLVEYLRNKGC
jgi:glycyl-tRNA synthetase